MWIVWVWFMLIVSACVTVWFAFCDFVFAACF